MENEYIFNIFKRMSYLSKLYISTRNNSSLVFFFFLDFQNKYSIFKLT